MDAKRFYAIIAIHSKFIFIFHFSFFIFLYFIFINSMLFLVFADYVLNIVSILLIKVENVMTM
jgi:hypothetical protein